MADCSDAIAKSAGVASQPFKGKMAVSTTKEFSIPVANSMDTLAYLDRHHTGQVSVHDLKVGIHELRMMKKFVLFLVVLAGVLLVGMCFVSYLAVTLAKEMHVRDQRLVDTDGRGVSTFDIHDTIHGITVADGRRLASFNMTAVDASSFVQMSSEAFRTTREEYTAGKTDWIVDMPDGTVRTVHIQGMGAEHAWGLCGACDGSVRWQAICSWENSSDCVLNWHPSSSVARRADAFLARAERPAANADNHPENSGLDRSLGGKCNI